MKQSSKPNMVSQFRALMLRASARQPMDEELLILTYLSDEYATKREDLYNNIFKDIGEQYREPNVINLLDQTLHKLLRKRLVERPKHGYYKKK